MNGVQVDFPRLKAIRTGTAAVINLKVSASACPRNLFALGFHMIPRFIG
jgi:hypothetical protein